MIRNKKASSTTDFAIFLILALFLAGLWMVIGGRYGYEKPKKQLDVVWTDIEKKSDLTGGAWSDLDGDGVSDDTDLCCHCDEKGETVGGKPVAKEGQSRGCAAGQTQTGAGTCVGPCEKNVA